MLPRQSGVQAARRIAVRERILNFGPDLPVRILNPDPKFLPWP